MVTNVMVTNVMAMNLTPGYYDVFYDGAIQSQISEKFVCPLASQNAISYNCSMYDFHW